MEPEEVRDDDLELELLTAMMVLWYGSTLLSAHTLTIMVLGLPPTPLDDSAIRQVTLKAQSAAAQVNETTKKHVAQRVAEGESRSLTRREIAYGTEDFPGIKGLFEDTWKSRPQMVAETELQKAQLEATVQRWQTLAPGRLTGWAATDGDYDAQCSARHGRIFPANNPPGLLHPHCRLRLTPIIDGGF